MLSVMWNASDDSALLQQGIINMAKRAQCSEVLLTIQLYQQTPYVLQPVPMIMDFLKVRCIDNTRPLPSQKLYACVGSIRR
jgi:hypothetical protein